MLPTEVIQRLALNLAQVVGDVCAWSKRFSRQPARPFLPVQLGFGGCEVHIQAFGSSGVQVFRRSGWDFQPERPNARMPERPSATGEACRDLSAQKGIPSCTPSRRRPGVWLFSLSWSPRCAFFSLIPLPPSRPGGIIVVAIGR